MADSWGNEGNNGEGTQKDQDMVSPNGYTLEVTEVNDDSKVGLKTSNTDGADAVALEANGKVEITGVATGNLATKGLLVTH